MTLSNTALVEHLVRRAGFGTTPDELQHYQKLGYSATLKELLYPQHVDNSQLDSMIEAQNFDFTRIDDLKRWWIYRMAYTKRPLEEKMTLFWHGHFATSNRKVNNAYAMYMQNQKQRRLGMGNFEDLLLAMSKDPAMIVWLDNQQNRKGKPNENYAREIMELFTLGIGNYTEQDIKEAARAFTGWETHPNGFFFNAKQHDYESKTFLQESGKFNGDDIVALLVEQPAMSHFIAAKMCKFFVCDQPSETIVEHVAQAYSADHDDNIKRMLKALFTHHQFKSAASYHAKIKSPVELVIGTLKTLQVQKLDADLPSLLGRMGQNLFEPPSVKGWDGGQAWISTDTMMERFNFATRITQQKFDAMEGYISPCDLAKKQGLNTIDSLIDYFTTLLVDADVSPGTKEQLKNYLSTTANGKPIDPLADGKLFDAKLRGLIHLIMTLPTYQLA